MSEANRASTLSQVQAKYDQLRVDVAELGNLAVAFSGGVDSTLLLKVAHEELGSNAVAITARACTFPEREFEVTREFCEENGIQQFVVDIDPFSVEGFEDNPSNRCYLCKKYIFENIFEVAKEHGIEHVAEGSNLDDDLDYRPGHQAILELGAISPLLNAGLTKDDIRIISMSLGLETWDKPSFSCLATRFPYGEKLTLEKLDKVDKAEQVLFDAGFEQVRVRVHGDIARIEIMPVEMEDLVEPEQRKEVVEKFHDLGFKFVAMDLDAYRTGSMNATLDE
ncbi:MAG: ATP-dependent sacrificial sulfur transferase LarE [Coriobacteriales bacterium]|jgi:uncharacterized protein